ncbi:MAG: cobalamin-dependent protein [Candidatus Pacebacteria bacterium]|nr:cobalamin-dependent protein [Candidatus Paceibacterota bacterium]
MKSTLLETNGWPLVRFIVPAYPEVNIFSRNRIVPLGIINVATAASMLWGWRAEIIDENCYTGPRDKNGLPDHERLQRENPAASVGFYCGLTSTMDRVFELSKFYKGKGCVTMAGGWHAHYCPEEALDHNMDIVVHGEGETATRDILSAFKAGNDISGIPGISYREGREHKRNLPDMLEAESLDDLPYPNFGLIRYRAKIKTFPVNWTKGCAYNCEFCSVKGEPRWVSPQHAFDVINWLVETQNAKSFFVVDDRLDGNREGILRTLSLISKKYGDRLNFTVQIRLEAAKDTELLVAMKEAGVRTVCIGYESPIAEDLNAMHKGLSPQKMIEWTLTMRKHFWVHGMFIFGYPSIVPSKLGVPETIKRYKEFIRAANISSIQILHPVPLVGTELRTRLEKEGRIFPRDIVPWSMYDGSYACFYPTGMTVKDLQDSPMEIMKWFYSSWSFWRIPIRTLAFPIHYVVAGWHHWYYGWFQDLVKYGGHRILCRWFKNQAKKNFTSRLEAYEKGAMPDSRQAKAKAAS